MAAPAPAAPRPRRTRPARGARSGQVLPLVLLTALVLLFAALWVVDVHHAIRAKDRLQDAGDAAAIEAARWQALSLNLAGELNLLHAAALAAGDAAAAEAATNAQARILFAGPLAGLAAAQQAAKLGGVPSNPDFTDFVRERAGVVRREYAADVGGETALPEPWPGAWDEYADMLDAIAADGVAAGPDNAVFHGDPDGAHLLLDTAFYEAVLGRDWCWFHAFAPDLLRSYSGWSSWPPLPPASEEPPRSAEFLPLWLRPSVWRVADVLLAPGFANAMDAAGYGAPQGADFARATNAPPQAFWTFDRVRWGAWTAMKEPSFPLRGDLRPEYDVAGPDAVMRVEAPVDRLSVPGSGSTAVEWSGAAKPFGILDDPDLGRVVPTAVPLLLPAWSDVRLIPLDASSAPAGGAFRLSWRRHRIEHLPAYLAEGTRALVPGCRWCLALARWEVPEFRQSGARWLSTNAWKCVLAPPGGAPGGGTGHAH